ARPNCGPPGTDFFFEGDGFQPGESVGIWATAPDQQVIGARFQLTANDQGHVAGAHLPTPPTAPAGIWAATMQGISSHLTAIAYFKITARPSTPTPVPGTPGPCDTSSSRNGEAQPNHGRPGDTIFFTARGFQSGEAV